MSFSVRVVLTPSAEQHARLVALQAAFAEVCNELAPIVQDTRVWNRVALHHMTYKGLRAKYPQLGSQMVCNAIYSVSRTCRLIFQTPDSPFHLSRLGTRPLPRLRFAETCPVYFDRHTLSLKDGRVSMFTMDGRIKFQLALSNDQVEAFRQKPLLEIVLQRRAARFELEFLFGPRALLKTDRSDLMAEHPNPPSLQVSGCSESGEADGLGGNRQPPVQEEAHSSRPFVPEYLKLEEFVS